MELGEAVQAARRMTIGWLQRMRKDEASNLMRKTYLVRICVFRVLCEHKAENLLFVGSLIVVAGLRRFSHSIQRKCTHLLSQVGLRVTL